MTSRSDHHRCPECGRYTGEPTGIPDMLIASGVALASGLAAAVCAWWVGVLGG